MLCGFQNMYREVISQELSDLSTGTDNELTSITYAVAHKDEFRLLFECSGGTKYEGFREHLIHEVFYKGKNCFDQKEIDKYVRGSERSKKREYPMDWVFDFSYDLSVPEYYVTHRECGVCKIGQQEDLMFLTPHMCVMDYPTIEYKGGKLLRTKTLGAGGDCCDFHVVKGDN